MLLYNFVIIGNMKGIKKSLGISLSVILLLSFSVTLIPLNLFHSHKVTQTSCKVDKSHASCTHKLNITKKADFCWACAVHFDQSFTNTSVLENIRLSPAISVFADNRISGHFIEQIFSSLRGPPSE